jgi:hypothetical protein
MTGVKPETGGRPVDTGERHGLGVDVAFPCGVRRKSAKLRGA